MSYWITLNLLKVLKIAKIKIMDIYIFLKLIKVVKSTLVDTTTSFSRSQLQQATPFQSFLKENISAYLYLLPGTGGRAVRTECESSSWRMHTPMLGFNFFLPKQSILWRTLNDRWEALAKLGGMNSNMGTFFYNTSATQPNDAHQKRDFLPLFHRDEGKAFHLLS